MHQLMRESSVQNNFLTPSQWLSQFLSSRNLDSVTGGPLFTLHVSENEYFNLKSFLKYRKPSTVTFKDRDWCACFCLFGAEWYRREYKSGWAWLGIFEQLGYELDANHRSTVVIKGLTFWKRPINKHSSDRNDYLGSVYSEGGLPFGLLASEGSRFQTLFKKLLIEFDKAKTFGQSPIPLIERQLLRMPDAFKEESTVTLLHDMVSNLYGLIDTYELDNKTNPPEYLDSMMPKWRISFPIPLDNKTGDIFLSGLLHSAAQQRKESKKREQRLKLSQWFIDSDELSFSASITVNSKLPVALKKKDLSAPIVEVLVYEGHSQIADLGIARAEVFDDNLILHMRKLNTVFRRFVNESPLKLVIMQAGRVRHIEEIPESSLPHDEMPILLKKSKDKHIVIGSGTTSKKSENLDLIISKNAKLTSENAELFVDVQRGNYRFLTFSGELSIDYSFDNHTDTYELSTKEDSFSKELLTISGEMFEFETDKGYPVFKGLPQISCDFPNTSILIGDNEVSKVNNLSNFYGRQVLRVKNGDKTLCRRKLAILPKDFDMELFAGQKSNQGSVSIHSEKAFIYKVGDNLKVQAVSIEGGKRINLIADGIPPPHFEMTIQANLISDPIDLKIPFPSRGAILFDGNGRELPFHFSVDGLLGARINLFKQPGKVSSSFEIELKAPTSASGNASYVFHYQVNKFIEEVNLFDLREKIKELLATAQSSELDEVVRMIISGPGMQTKQYTIGWFALFGIKDENLLTFEAKANIDFSGLKAELINLGNPEQKPTQLAQRISAGACIGKFELPLVSESPQLAVPEESSRVQFRPVFIPPTTSNLDHKSVKSLGKAAETFHPIYNKFAFDKVLDAMTSDIEHSGWRYFDCFLDKYSHLPMLTFEAFKALARHPKCLAVLPFATKLNVASVLQVLQTEFNIVWELIPLEMWRGGLDLYQKNLEKIGLPEMLITKYVNEKTANISNFISLPDIFLLQPNKKAMYHALINIWREELLRENADISVRWPQQYNQQLYSWVTAKFPELAIFNVPNDFQRAVMYFPLAAAVVASTDTTWEEVFSSNDVNYFLLRQLMEFDRNWFNSVYQCSLCFFISE
ncbi:hypothetical protein ATS74_06830 [Pseudoalteromonas sp. H103]|nr:hypothetical protein ATS74_06830 [Pseudoalteromonas sp. H103]